jgi:hypothetical protein
MPIIAIVLLAIIVLSLVVIQAAIASEAAPRCDRCHVPAELLFDECEHIGGGWMTGLRLLSCPGCGSLLEQHYSSGSLD